MILGIISFSMTIKYLKEPGKEQKYIVLEDEYIEMDFNNRNYNEQSSSHNTQNVRNHNIDDEFSNTMASDSLSEKKDLGLIKTIKFIFTKSSWIAISCYCMLSLATMLFFTVSLSLICLLKIYIISIYYVYNIICIYYIISFNNFFLIIIKTKHLINIFYI